MRIYYMIQLVVMSVTGLVCLIFGLLIWKKEKITLIHSYHYTRVAEENKSAYTSRIGKALIIMSVGMFVTGGTNYLTGTLYGGFSCGLFVIWGLVIILKAQKKYNGGIF